MTQVILFNKPFHVLCQFSPHEQKTTLKDFIDIQGFYPCGRLDYDSEGLLILSNKGSLQSLISQPRHKMTKTYLVQVEGDIGSSALTALAEGVQLKDGLTRPAEAQRVAEPDWLWPRHPPIRERRHIPTSWVELSIREGKNRQVRRMTAAVGYPTLRLIRIRVGPWSLTGLNPGSWNFSDVPEKIETKLNRLEAPGPARKNGRGNNAQRPTSSAPGRPRRKS